GEPYHPEPPSYIPGSPSPGTPMRFRYALLAAGLVLLSLPHRAAAQTQADHDAVRQAVLDYVEGFYEGDTTRFIRSVRPEVDKFGFWRNQQGAYQGGAFRWEQFFSFARDVREGRHK